ncbi:MAG: hypothetical protein IKH67_01685 [Lachnospiraceae bacterium]|nr:hypothetical protein [Lachnospiraceae bacterium]MBR6349347.1 hypothetical protein [Lachnospiraceae bacterium]
MNNRRGNFFYRLRAFMQGRYGRDSVTFLLLGIAIVLMILSWIPKLWFLYFFSIAIIVLSILRSMSRNFAARERENRLFLKIVDWFRKVFHEIASFFSTRRRMWRERNTHSYYRCPKCGCYVRISKPPKGKKIMVTCSHCYNQFVKRT